ncbi:MAG TPA: hypothetical protein VIO33_15990 [Burkholderiaceae bacterium]
MSSSDPKMENGGWAATAVMPTKSGATPSRRETPEVWEATRAQTAMATQILHSEEDYLAEKPEIGRPTGANTHELFVSCAPAEALQQQFEHLHPDYIAVHDICTSSARKLLVGIAAASARNVQKLVIRRQGHGTLLATIEFVELPTPGGSTLRLYATDAETDAATRPSLSRTLLAFSRLGVVMVGEVPAHAIPTVLQPLRESIVAGPWPNRHLLLLPLTTASTLAAQGAELGLGTGVTVRTTPQVTRPADAWGFINGAWSRVLGDLAPAASANADTMAARHTGQHASPRPVPQKPAAAATAPSPATAVPAALPMRPMPQVTPSGERKVLPEGALERYMHHLSELAGMVSCCIFEIATGRDVLHAGASPSAADLASHGSALLGAMTTTSRTLGFGHSLPEAAITLGGHHLLLRAVPGHPGLALHAVLDKSHANLTLARLQVLRMDSLLDEAPPAYAERRSGPRAGPEARRH